MLRKLSAAKRSFNLLEKRALYRKTQSKRYKTTVLPLSDTWDDSQSTVHSVGEGSLPMHVKVDDPAFEKIDLSFENAEVAFKSKSNYELFRSLLVFNLCSIPAVVSKNKQVS